MLSSDHIFSNGYTVDPAVTSRPTAYPATVQPDTVITSADPGVTNMPATDLTTVQPEPDATNKYVM